MRLPSVKDMPRMFDNKRYVLDSTFTTKPEVKARIRKLRESGYKARMHRTIVSDIHVIEVYRRR